MIPPRRKFRNRPTEIDGHKFDSQAEGRRYEELRLLELAGEISDLRVHPKWDLVVNGALICRYTADFCYLPKGPGDYVIEDVKGGQATKTAVYKIKKKLMLALVGLDVVEVQA